MPENTPGGTGRLPGSKPRPEITSTDPDDEILAAVYIRMWALASGRTLRRDVPPSQLGEDELIEFWADDLTEYAGRHAAPETAGHSRAADNLNEAPHPATRPRRRKRRRSRGKAASKEPEVR